MAQARAMCKKLRGTRQEIPDIRELVMKRQREAESSAASECFAENKLRGANSARQRLQIDN
jgi:hypothetical protein